LGLKKIGSDSNKKNTQSSASKDADEKDGEKKKPARLGTVNGGGGRTTENRKYIPDGSRLGRRKRRLWGRLKNQPRKEDRGRLQAMIAEKNDVSKNEGAGKTYIWR